MVGSPRIIYPCAFHADPTVLSRLAHRSSSCLVVTAIVRSGRLGMESVVCGLAVRASAWVCGEIATVQTWSRDAHCVVCLLALSTIARQHKQATRRCVACALLVETLSYFVRVCWVFTRNLCLLVSINKQQASMCLELFLRVVN